MIGVSLIVGGISLLVSYKIPPIFTATTKFLPPQQQTSAATAMIQSLGAVSALTGAATGLKNPGDQYVSFLKSRAVLDAVVKRFDLIKRYELEFKEDAARALEESTTFLSGKDGLIVVSVDDKSPKVAAEIANAYVEELGGLLDRLALTETQQRRKFFEKQLLATKEKLINAEEFLKKSGVSSSVLKLTPVSAIEGIAKLQAEIKMQEVKVSGLTQYMTEDALELKRARAELMALREQLKKMDRIEGVGDEGSDYVARYREYKYQETLYDLISRQYEIARVDEAREGALIQVVDFAQPPERKSKPSKLKIVLTSVIFSWVAIFVIFVIYEKKARLASKSMAL